MKAGARRGAILLVTLAALWGLWEGYRALWIWTGWTWPFAVDDTTMPHLHDIVAAFWQPTTTGGPPLIHSLIDAAWFTMKEALAGFLIGAIVGELPSGIQSGLGGAILNFNQYYSSEPKDLWATNVVAAIVGIVFFLVVVVAERLVVRRAPEHVA